MLYPIPPIWNDGVPSRSWTPFIWNLPSQNALNPSVSNSPISTLFNLLYNWVFPATLNIGLVPPIPAALLFNVIFPVVV